MPEPKEFNHKAEISSKPVFRRVTLKTGEQKGLIQFNATVSEYKKTDQGFVRTGITDYKVTAWGESAEHLVSRIHSGMELNIKGRLTGAASEWTSPDGKVKRTYHELLANANDLSVPLNQKGLSVQFSDPRKIKNQQNPER